MNPLLLFLLALASPLLLAITLLLPAYAGVFAAVYVIYDKAGASPHPLAHHLTDVFYIGDVYAEVLGDWAQKIDVNAIPLYTAPLLLFPLLGGSLSLWLTGKLSHKLMNVFQLGVHH